MSRAHPHRLKVGSVTLVALLAAVSLSGCEGARRALGYDKAPPDEFTVVARAPLAQPPDFQLRPPAPGATRPQEGTTRDQAKTALLGGRANATPPMGPAERSHGEQIMLAKAGADKIEPDIRRKVNEETNSVIEADKSFSDKVLFWQEKPPPGDVIDAKAEAKRLQENASLGKSPSEGDTPQIVRRKKGWLEGIF